MEIGQKMGQKQAVYQSHEMKEGQVLFKRWEREDKWSGLKTFVDVAQDIHDQWGTLNV